MFWRDVFYLFCLAPYYSFSLSLPPFSRCREYWDSFFFFFSSELLRAISLVTHVFLVLSVTDLVFTSMLRKMFQRAKKQPVSVTFWWQNMNKRSLLIIECGVFLTCKSHTWGSSISLVFCLSEFWDEDVEFPSYSAVYMKDRFIFSYS